MAAKRTSLKDRRAQDRKGVDAIIPTSSTIPSALDAARTKVTVYIRPDQVVAIEDLQLAIRKDTGTRPDKSALMQQAIDLLMEKHTKPV